MTQKLLILMLDGISADYFRTERARMPFIDALANRGCYVSSLHAEVIGVSLAGRTSMMTGQTGAVHSITGNTYWEDKSASEHDIPLKSTEFLRHITFPQRASVARITNSI